MTGGSGDDTYRVDNAGDQVVEATNGGIGTVRSDLPSYVLGANVENLVLTGSANINGIGNSLDNHVTGNDADNVLLGGKGSDTLTGGGGDDILNGGTGSDRMIGGTGNDTYHVGNAGDVVIEHANAGTDTVLATINYGLPDNVENLILDGTAPISGYGNWLANVIIGNAGANNIDGYGGFDTLTGGGGADTFRMSEPLDAQTNFARITDFTPGTDKIALTHSVFTKIGTGEPLRDTTFVVGTHATAAEPQIIYDPTKGGLYYDADGTGPGAQVEFASVTAGLTLHNTDFIVI